MTVEKLVEVFARTAITLDINLRKCQEPSSPDPHATNNGPSALDLRAEIARAEGGVLCTSTSRARAAR